MVAKNKQREPKLADARGSKLAETGEKRSAESGDDHQIKRPKVGE